MSWVHFGDELFISHYPSRKCIQRPSFVERVFRVRSQEREWFASPEESSQPHDEGTDGYRQRSTICPVFRPFVDQLFAIGGGKPGLARTLDPQTSVVTSVTPTIENLGVVAVGIGRSCGHPHRSATIGRLSVAADAAEGLSRLVDVAYEKRSVAISSNLHPAAFDELCPRPSLPRQSTDSCTMATSVRQRSGPPDRTAPRSVDARPGGDRRTY